MLYESQEAAIKLFNDYSPIMSEAKYKTKHGEGIKILTPKQMLQRLSIALAQAGNTSEYLLNKIRQNISSLYQAKKLLRKYITILWIQWSYNIKNEYYIYEFWE